MNVKVLLDLDGVLADFVNHACRFHNSPNPYMDKSNWGKFELPELLNLTDNKFWQGMNHEFWSTLPLMPDAHRIVEAVESVVGISNVCILTSPAANPECASGKMAWIERCFPSYRRRFLIGSQKEFCAHSRSILIDDFERNVQHFEQAGGHTIFVPRPWNSRHTDCEQDIPIFLHEKLKWTIDKIRFFLE